MRFTKLLLFSISIILAAVTGCKQSEQPRHVDPTKVDQKRQNGDAGKTAGMRIAVGAMITPKQGFVYYREFLDYISRRTGETVHYVDAENYDEINRKLKRGELDAGFVCSGPYVDGKREFGLELLAAPRAYGKNVYYAYIIVPKGSSAKSLDDLKGKKFAFTDPLSNTGKLVPEFMLKSEGTTPEQFFSKVVYSGSHDKSITAVGEALVDGASVDSLIWDYISRTAPEITAKTRIIRKSEPYGIPPFVVRPGLDPVIREKLKGVLLNAHADPEGKAILDKMMIERFEPIHDNAYDSIREMKRLTGK